MQASGSPCAFGLDVPWLVLKSFDETEVINDQISIVPCSRERCPLIRCPSCPEAERDALYVFRPSAPVLREEAT